MATCGAGEGQGAPHHCHPGSDHLSDGGGHAGHRGTGNEAPLRNHEGSVCTAYQDHGGQDGEPPTKRK